jgi:predicted phage terminase large subunit-like protein
VSGDVEIKFDLHPAQMQVFSSRARFRVLVAGRRFGKSYEAIAEAVCAALDPANVKRQPVFLIAPTQPQAKLLYWRPLLDKLHRLVVSTNVNEGLITLNNGVMIGVKGADNPDALRGPGLWFAGLDEYASMKPYVWGEIIRPALADSLGRALFIGTPSGRNHFYEMYEAARSGDDPEWAAWHFESIENPFLPKGEVENARKSMSSAAFNKEFRASFDTGSGGTFKPEWVKYQATEPKDGAYVMTVDLAGFTDIEKATTSKQRLLDEHVIATAKIVPEPKSDIDLWWVHNIQKGRWSVKDCAKRIVDTLIAVKPMVWGMERGALYNAVLPAIQEEALRRGHLLMAPVPLTHGNRIKTERIVWALQGRLEHGKITFKPAPWNRDVEDQLAHFPSRMVHDDIPDALSYIAQLTQGRVFQDFSGFDDEPYWKPQDATVGF